MKQGKDKAGTMHCFKCMHKWTVKDRFAYQQCARCKSYKVYAEGSIAYYCAIKERDQMNGINKSEK